MYNFQDQQLLYGLELAKLRYSKEEERARNKKAQLLQYQPQHFNQYEHPLSIFNRSSLDSIPLAQPGMPVIPIPFTMMPWPMESQIQMGFDFQRSKNQQEIRQQRIENIMNIGKPKPIQKPGDKILYPHDSLSNSRLSTIGQSQLIQYPQQYQQYQQYQQQQQQQYQQYQQQQMQKQSQQKQEIDKLLISNQYNKHIPYKQQQQLNDQQIKEEFKNSLHKSKLSNNSIIKSSSHSSQQNFIKKTKKKLPVSSKRFRIFKASIIFISYYIKTLNSEIEKKLKICRERDAQIPNILDYLLGEYETALEQQMIEFLNNKIDFKVEIGRDKENQAKFEKVFAFITRFLKQALTIKPDTINSIFFDFLRSICIPNQFPPLEYFVQYEAERIRFNTIGQIGKISESIQLMIIEGVILLRILVNQMIFKAWEYHPSQDNQEVLFFIHRNALIVGSILVHLYLERYINEIPLKFDWGKVQWNRIKILPQIYDDDEPDNKKTVIKNLLPQQIITPYLKYLAAQTKKNNEIQDLLNQIMQGYLKELNKQTEIVFKEKEEKPRMISLIMNTIYREIYVSKRPRRYDSN
ncbi:unnamed protein product [Paramecium primaurelia]|uniref:Uncharacterized protein n=1 Tax=Paramecium primaurelia TaxID=5886 RepID=A0A8S1NYN6_PARPR|nr:unnamed protein product [Paramecium primaurelia]